MIQSSFDAIYFCYNFIEKYILRDYQEAMRLINTHLLLSKNQRVIDIGGGTGEIASSINDRVAMVTIIDPSRKMLQRIKNSLLHPVQGDGSSLGIKNDVFDVALLINTLHHIPSIKQKSVLKEIYRILQNHGELFLLDLFFPMTLGNRVFHKIEEIAVGKTFHLPSEKVVFYLKTIGFTEISVHLSEKHRWRYLITAKKRC